jgi:tRNA-Thr(GGU) m(6)t(6)A37 methyltransferase TsaA
MEFSFKPIGIIHSCYKEKFGIPRQPRLVTEARAVLELLPPYNREEALKGLEGFSHVWIMFIFHASMREHWKATVRPPRLGGNRRLGVFATRSNFRPNPLGMSAVELENFGRENGKICLHLKGGDFLDGTPVVDLKPYVPFVDSIPDARGGFAHEAPAADLDVEFSPQARQFCLDQEKAAIPKLREFITQMLRNDPRPAYYDSSNPQRESFGIRIYQFDVRWTMHNGQILVTEIVDEPRNTQS